MLVKSIYILDGGRREKKPLSCFHYPITEPCLHCCPSLQFCHDPSLPFPHGPVFHSQPGLQPCPALSTSVSLPIDWVVSTNEFHCGHGRRFQTSMVSKYSCLTLTYLLSWIQSWESECHFGNTHGAMFWKLRWISGSTCMHLGTKNVSSSRKGVVWMFYSPF